MRKNVASQTIAFQMNSTAAGVAVTSGTPTVYYTIDGGTQGTGGGSSTHEGNGQWSYVPAQAETNGAHVAFTMALSGAISQTVNVWPVSYNPGDSDDLGLTALTGHTPQTGDSYARLGAPAGASVSADLADLPTVAEFEARTLVSADYVITSDTIAGVTLVATTTDVTNQVTADVTAISGDSTAADNAELAFDGTGFGFTNCTIPTVSTLTGHTVQTGDSYAYLGTNLGALGANATEAGGTGDQLTAVPWNSSWDAEVESECNDALVAIHLDHVFAVDYDPASKPGVATALLNELVENDAGVSRFTANALEEAPTGGSAPTATEIVDEWETQSQADPTGFHVNVQEIGDTAQTPNDNGADINTLVTRVTAAVATEAKQDIIDTVVDAIKTQTDQFVFTTANKVDSRVDYVGANAVTTPDDFKADVSALATAAALTTVDTVVDAIKAVTDNLPNSGALTDLATAAALTIVDTVVDRIEVDTQDIQSRIPAALASGRMSSDSEAISGSTDAADKLEASTETMVIGTVSHDNTAAITTIFYSDDVVEATADHFNGRKVIFTSGAVIRQATSIEDYELESGEGKFTVVALTEAPADNVTFIIV